MSSASSSLGMADNFSEKTPKKWPNRLQEDLQVLLQQFLQQAIVTMSAAFQQDTRSSCLSFLGFNISLHANWTRDGILRKPYHFNSNGNDWHFPWITRIEPGNSQHSWRHQTLSSWNGRPATIWRAFVPRIIVVFVAAAWIQAATTKMR